MHNDAPLLSVHITSAYTDRRTKGAVPHLQNMPPPDCLSVRLVVQRIYESSSRQCSYRLIVYSNDQTYRPAWFEALDDVLKVLKAGLPEFDGSLFSKKSQRVTAIVFADEVELSRAQLLILGLKE